MHSTRTGVATEAALFPQVAQDLAAKETRCLLQVNDFQRKRKRQADQIVAKVLISSNSVDFAWLDDVGCFFFFNQASPKRYKDGVSKNTSIYNI